MRDTQRGRVYKAERRMSTKGQEYASLDEMKKRIDRIATSKWWKFHFASTGKLTVVRQRGGARATGTFMVSFGKSMQYDLWIMHELGHIAVARWKGNHRHGPEFTRAYLLLVRRYMGASVADELKTHFKACGVKIARRKAAAIELKDYDTSKGYLVPKPGWKPKPPKVVWDEIQTQQEEFVLASPKETGELS